MGNNPSEFNGDDRPVEQVSWDDVQIFISKLYQVSPTVRYRLPSEAEWEYACRAGTRTPIWTGDRLLTNQANYDGNYPYPYDIDEDEDIPEAELGEYRRETTPEGTFPANPWGLHDMHGNVFEWCQDHWHGDYHGAPDDGSEWKDDAADEELGMVFRGGSWNGRAGHCLSAFRLMGAPGVRHDLLGFRLVRL